MAERPRRQSLHILVLKLRHSERMWQTRCHRPSKNTLVGESARSGAFSGMPPTEALLMADSRVVLVERAAEQAVATIRLTLLPSAVAASFSAAGEYTRLLCELREAQHSTCRLRRAAVRKPEDSALARRLQETEAHVLAVSALLGPAQSPPTPVGWQVASALRGLRTHGVLAAHVRLLGVETLGVEQLHGLRGVAVVFPCWLCEAAEVIDARGAGAVLRYVRTRHGPGTEYRELAVATVSSRAAPQWSPSPLDEAQSLPAWQWALVSLASGWAWREQPSRTRAAAYTSELGVPEPFRTHLLDRCQ